MLDALDLPPLPHAEALASWLGIDADELVVLADCEGRERRRPPRAQHYHYRRVAKPSGGERLIEAPKPRLKAVQRRILHGILDRVPPHDAAHGFVPGRSVWTGAGRHTGRELVIRVDLRDFFASVRGARVFALFETVGYPRPVCSLLTGLCTNATPATVWGTPSDALSTAALRERWHRIQRYAAPHLPAGAPSSPALANLAAHRLDRRLAGLAHAVDGSYTRYADDLTFSGDALRRGTLAFFSSVCRIVVEEGFEVHARKTRFHHRSQRQLVTGVVVNEHPAAPRSAYDRLRAMLFNCVRHGARSQADRELASFRAHLRGRIEWFAHSPARAAKLHALFDRIDFSELDDAPPADG